ncbi:MAG: OmpP1/FadL family transporter [Planktomarina sp.]
MRNLFITTAACALVSGAAVAGGLDRSNQSITSIFDDPGTASVSFGSVRPSITGSDALNNNYDVGKTYTQLSFSTNVKLSENFTLGLIYDQPYGADIEYNGNPAATILGGTKADISSNAVSFLGKYQVNENVSVYGGLRVQSVKGDVTLSGLAYGASSGYNASLSSSTGYGYTLGAAYEIPDIALRAAVTYISEIDHSAPTTETLNGAPLATSTTDFSTPSAINLDFQTGIAQGTLLTASIRKAAWGDFDVTPQFVGSDLADLDDSTRYTLGIGRAFTDNFAMSATINYEAEGSSSQVSPLAPTNGQTGITIGARYNMNGMVISGGVNYTKVGDADAALSGTTVATFEDNSVLGFGIKVGMDF